MPSWLTRDRASLSRRRRKDSTASLDSSALQSPHPKSRDPPLRSPLLPDKLRQTKRGSHKPGRAHKRADTLPILPTQPANAKPDSEDALASTSFTVGHVGAGGILYLKPSRVDMSNSSYNPAPAQVSSNDAPRTRSRPLQRASDVSGTWTPLPDRARNAAMAGLPMRPTSLATTHARPRPRSHSCYSTTPRRLHLSQQDGDNHQLSSAGGRASRKGRRRSAADLPQPALADVYIPHYRLGTPRFSERGTAYLHYSMAASTEGVPSSTFSRAEYEKLFPVPPARGINSFQSHFPGAPCAHPSSAYAASVASPTRATSARVSAVGNAAPAVFDSLESDLDDPAVVDRHPTTGQVVAATPARLIAQITSPQSLNYELLADFFLTFRCFMTCGDVLELLIARLRWAFADGNDAGRIARVRTFVALRHWILNYFVDDFMVDTAFRQSFCDLVNDLTASLRQRPDGGKGDINIIGDLKKCWRRTCALYWPIPDAHELSPDADIAPGGDTLSKPSQSDLSLPLTIRPTSGRRSIFEMTRITLPDRPDPWNGLHPGMQGAIGVSQRSSGVARIASIPASPSSEQSLEVLSCSVPFLSNLRPTARAREKRVPLAHLSSSGILETAGKNIKSTRPKHGHERSVSFADALRDHRTPFSVYNMDTIELKDLPAFAVTGGLIRGIVLQPSAPQVHNNIPATPGPPGPESNEVRFATNEHHVGTGQHIGVRKFVGEVRRALSTRKGGSRSPSRSPGSSGSESKGQTKRRYRPRKIPLDWQQLPGGHSRLDILGVRIQNSYQDAIERTRQRRPDTEPKRENLLAGQTSHTVSSKEDPLQNNSLPPKAHVGVPEPETPRPATGTRARLENPISGSGARESDALYSGRLNSHVTTGSRSIVIVDATGAAPEVVTPRGYPSFCSASTDMVPIPLFRDRNHRFLMPSLPTRSDGGIPALSTLIGAPNEGCALRAPDDRMHDLLTEPSAWEMLNRDSLLHSHASYALPRRSSSAIYPTAFEVPRLPPQLRRQPVGDLRATNHVHELNARSHRRHSMASLSTTSRSYSTSSVFSLEEPAVDRVMLLETNPESRQSKQRSVSLIQGLSSQAILRQSFVAEAEKLKSMPDIDTDGGIEDTLLKLEGKIPSPSKSTFSGISSGIEDSVAASYDSKGEPGDLANLVEQPLHAADHIDQRYNMQYGQEVRREEQRSSPDHRETTLNPPPAFLETVKGESRPVSEQPPPSSARVSSRSIPITETQGASIYLASDFGNQSVSSQAENPLQITAPAPEELIGNPSAPLTSVVTESIGMHGHSIPNTYSIDGGPRLDTHPLKQNPEDSYDVVSDARYPNYRPISWGDDQHQSFPFDDNDTLSQISTQLSSWHEDELGVRTFVFDETGEEHQPTPAPTRALDMPVTPPSTVGGATDDSSERRQLMTRYMRNDPNQPLKGMISHPRLLPQTANQPFPHRPYNGNKMSTDPPGPSFPAHLPFVLAYDSEIIAEQLTIIEKDALDEVEWKDLIGLDWSQNPPDVRNWVEYLNREPSNGIDIIIARFNLVVKWCVSEVVLTEIASERARAITKYIHIASHCHRLRNYASMYQIVLALLSDDIARLHRSWALVAARDKQILERLETLCQPLRNFYTLRQEMETAMPSDGIIPFIGLYTHDLMFNALKSSLVESPQRGREPLVNFERYQTAAAIVKNLLRLIEASARYDFRPEPEALARCLWIAALEDHEIAARSKALEQN